MTGPTPGSPAAGQVANDPGSYNAGQAAAAAAGAASSSGSGATDIWGLGARYNDPVFWGVLGTGQSSLGGGPAVAPTAGSPAAAQLANNPTGPYSPQSNVYKTATQAMAQLPVLYASDAQGYLGMQQRLYKAGFYGTSAANTIAWGAYDTATIDAYRRAVLAAAQLSASGAPVTFSELLDQNARNVAANLAGAPPQPRTYTLTDPALVAGTAQKAAQDTLGRNLSAEEVQTFVQSYANEERTRQQAAYDAQVKGGTVVGQDITQQALGAEATRYAKTTHPTEYHAQQLAGYVAALEGLVGGGTRTGA